MDTLRKLLRLKPAEQQKLEDQRTRLTQQKTRLVDEQQALIDELKKLKQRVKFLKEDYDKATGPERKIIASRIEHTLAELEGAEQKADILDTNVRHVALGIQRVDEALTAGQAGITESELDDITGSHAEAVDEMKGTQQAAADLEKSKFNLGREPMDVDAAVSKLERPAGKKGALSKATQKKLKDLLSE